LFFETNAFSRRVFVVFYRVICLSYNNKRDARFRSEKIKPFVQTVLEKENVPLFHYLTDAMMSTSQYESTVKKALAIPDCPVVPFFGYFMRDIRKIMKETPSTIVLSDQDARVLSEVRTVDLHANLSGRPSVLVGLNSRCVRARHAGPREFSTRWAPRAPFVFGYRSRSAEPPHVTLPRVTRDNFRREILFEWFENF